ncbi:hypothetical protein O6H91_08G018200 [Diphasiastrum complanatum]|uniref:Uncharacterized protein n=2 Tax=Diphasiastrum complanatum TaxID=34168 RepID=A0ACC2A7C8_DIPCM|nr:hypothetical protein O6H91_24G007800 [Diphasiastrum complanatum]KAJ7545963.1 hypothetical protein O6H91_08G018200 [Diphasiastrum complanatum]
MAAAAVEVKDPEDNRMRNSKYVKGVQCLVETGITQIPDAYIQPPHLRLSVTKFESSNEIPVIDLAGLEDDRRSGVLEEIRNASERWGFFQVINHGVPVPVIERMMDVSRRFHELPTEEKMEHHSVDPSRSYRFQTSFNAEKQKVLEWRDSLVQRCYPPPEDDKWLKNPSDYRDAAMDYSRELRKLLKLLLAAMSEGLNLSSDTLEKCLGEEFTQMFLVNYYPPCPNPDLVLGVNSHSDPGGLTVLFQDEIGGLQVFNEGNWFEVKPLANAFVINVADQLEVLSNGIYKSVDHRAIRRIGDVARISVATFCNPTREAKIGPIAELTKMNPPLYKEYLFSDFLHHFFSMYYDGKACLDNFKLPTKP